MIPKSDFFGSAVRMKEYIAGAEYCDLNRVVTHDRLAALSKVSGEVSDGTLNHIHDGILRYALATAENYAEQKKILDEEVWPKIREKVKNNPGMAQFLLENAMFSEFIPKFLVNVWGCPAKAVLPAHGVSDTLDGRPKIVPASDPMFPYMYDQSYRMIQFRTEVPQNDLKQAESIFFAGGGLLPELWANGYPLGEIDQTIIVYDLDSTLPAYLEKLLGGKLEDFGIEYHIGDYMTAPIERVDAVVANGIMAYEIKKTPDNVYDMSGFEAKVGNLCSRLKSGGKMFFDVQLLHKVLIFDLLTLAWPAGMTVIESFDKAVALIDPILKKVGFDEVEFMHEPVNTEFGENPAGMITVAQKA